MLKFLLFKRKPAPTTREAIQKIFEMESMLEKKLAHLNSKIDEQKKLAAANAKTNKRVALSALKKQHRLEKEEERAASTLSNLKVQRGVLENTKMNTEVVQVMSQGSAALKEGLKSAGGIDKIHDVIDDLAEHVEANNEIAESLSTPLFSYGEDDDDALLKELDELETRDFSKMPLPPSPSSDFEFPAPPLSLPEVPTASGSSHTEDDLSHLLEWAS